MWYACVGLGGCIDDRMSTSGYVFILAGGAILWRRNKQTTRAVSTMEFENVGCLDHMKQSVWLKNFISEIKVVNNINKR